MFEMLNLQKKTNPIDRNKKNVSNIPFYQCHFWVRQPMLTLFQKKTIDSQIFRANEDNKLVQNYYDEYYGDNPGNSIPDYDVEW